jgi:hypothetical protein
VFVRLIVTIAFGAVVSYSLFTIQHAQELSEKQRDDVDVAAMNKKRVISYIKAELPQPTFANVGGNVVHRWR